MQGARGYSGGYTPRGYGQADGYSADYDAQASYGTGTGAAGGTNSQAGYESGRSYNAQVQHQKPMSAVCMALLAEDLLYCVHTICMV